MLEISPIEIEQLALNAWPSVQTYLHGGMVVRWADGYTKRANSATVLFNGEWSADKQAWVEEFYRSRNLPPVFRLLSFNDTNRFDRQLESAGYEKLDLTNVMTVDLASISPAYDERCTVIPLGEWLEIFHQLDQSKLGDEKLRLHQAILERVPGTLCPMVLTIDQEPAACGLGVLDGGGIGLFDIVTAEKQRKKGLGTALIQSLLFRGKNAGMLFSFLQVTAKNEPATRIYVKSGFKILYNYWYRRNAR